MTRPSQKMQIQWINLDKLIPYARNPRKNDNAVSKTAGSIKEFGWKQPIVVDKDYVIVAGHSTQKPVECMKRPMENNSSPGQAVYEPFSGSGTTIIAAEMTGRACYAMEIFPAYVDIAVRRWQEFTGKLPCLNGKEMNLAT